VLDAGDRYRNRRLEEGKSVTAIVKASDVILAAD
jgi:molybdopterin-binding protein